MKEKKQISYIQRNMNWKKLNLLHDQKTYTNTKRIQQKKYTWTYGNYSVKITLPPTILHTTDQFIPQKTQTNISIKKHTRLICYILIIKFDTDTSFPSNLFPRKYPPKQQDPAQPSNSPIKSNQRNEYSYFL